MTTVYEHINWIEQELVKARSKLIEARSKPIKARRNVANLKADLRYYKRELEKNQPPSAPVKTGISAPNLTGIPPGKPKFNIEGERAMGFTDTQIEEMRKTRELLKMGEYAPK